MVFEKSSIMIHQPFARQTGTGAKRGSIVIFVFRRPRQRFFYNPQEIPWPKQLQGFNLVECWHRAYNAQGSWSPLALPPWIESRKPSNIFFIVMKINRK